MDFEAGLKAPDPFSDGIVDADFFPPEKRPKLTLAEVKPTFQEYVQATQKMAADAKAVTVEDDASLKFAVALGGESKKIVKAIEAQRKKVIAEPSDFVKAVNNFCKIFTEQLTAAEEALKKKISDYQYQQKLERREREAAARKAAQELQDRLNREAEESNRQAREEAARQAEAEAKARQASEAEIAAAKAKAEEEAKAREISAPVVAEPIIPTESRVVRTETGTAAHQRKVWKAEVVDAEAVPREYMVPDLKKINEAVKMGTRAIPGVRIFEESTTIFRS